VAGCVNGRELVVAYGLLRNSTIFCCAKNWDSNSARRMPPVSDDKLKQRPNCSHSLPHRKTSFLTIHQHFLLLRSNGISWGLEEDVA
jgi:hypothetical protein